MMLEIDTGKIRGQQTGAAFSFKGIPYAADTGGAHRFMAPRPHPGWAGVRNATALGERCPQTLENFVQLPVFSWYGQESAFGENCCVLNVFTPGLQDSARRPVLFYIHGGGYASGGGGGPALDGSRLAAFGDVVVVTVNHRLNLFGYTHLQHLDGGEFADAGTAGHLDLVAALQWVRRNISSFGGDPDNVTLVGQSGGGNKVMVLLTMPQAHGLFRRAINMSGVTGLQVVQPEQTRLTGRTAPGAPRPTSWPILAATYSRAVPCCARPRRRPGRAVRRYTCTTSPGASRKMAASGARRTPWTSRSPSAPSTAPAA